MNGHGQTDAKRVSARVGEEAEQKDSLGAVWYGGGHSWTYQGTGDETVEGKIKTERCKKVRRKRM